MAKLNDKDRDLLNKLLDEYSTIDSDKLTDIQRVIINLNANEKKTNDDYKSLRTMLKIEQNRIENRQLIADILAKQEKVKSDAQENFTQEFFNAVESKKVINGLSSTMTAKQLLQVLIDEKVVTSNSALRQFLKSVAGDELNKDTVTSKDTATSSENSENVADETGLTKGDLALNRLFNKQ